MITAANVAGWAQDQPLTPTRGIAEGINKHIQSMEAALEIARRELFLLYVGCISHLDPDATGTLNVEEMQRRLNKVIKEIDRIVGEQ